MNRRGFLKALGLVAAAPIALKLAPLVPEAVEATPVLTPATTVATTYLVGQEAVIGSYADYMTISDLALVTSLDPMVEGFAKELAYRMAYAVDTVSSCVV